MLASTPAGIAEIRAFVSARGVDAAYATSSRIMVMVNALVGVVESEIFSPGHTCDEAEPKGRPLKDGNECAALFLAYVSQCQLRRGLTLEDALLEVSHPTGVTAFVDYALKVWSVNIPGCTPEYVRQVLCPRLSPAWVGRARTLTEMSEIAKQYMAGLVTQAELIVNLQCNTHQLKAVLEYSRLPQRVQARCDIGLWDELVEDDTRRHTGSSLNNVGANS